jgi:hypothetical protein
MAQKKNAFQKCVAKACPGFSRSTVGSLYKNKKAWRKFIACVRKCRK